MVTSQQGLVSIIIPVFNGEEFISRAIDSCLKQSYKNIEIIIIDDGSTDNTKAIADLYSNRFPNVYYFHQENRERSAARNLGINLSKGEFIQFLDVDDELLENKIEEQLAVFSKNENISVVYGGAFYYSSGKKIKYLFIDAKENFLNKMIFSNFIPINSLLFRKGDIPFFDERLRLLEDWKFLIEILLRDKNFKGTNVPVCIVHIHGNNSSRIRREMCKAELVILDWLSEKKLPMRYNQTILYAKYRRIIEINKPGFFSQLKYVTLKCPNKLGAHILFLIKKLIRGIIR